MTDLRTAAQQALDALEMSRRFVYADNRPQCDDAIDVLRAALAQPETCTWHQDGDSGSDTYQTSCGHYFNLEDGTPEDNKMVHCCYCGKKLVQELIVEDSDE